MNTPIEVLLSVVAIDGRLGLAGDKLRMLLPADCTPDLKDEIRRHKPALLELLRLTFLIVRSNALDTIVLFAPNEATKASLAAAGAEDGSIYTAAELEILVHRGITVDELQVIHAAKQRFNGTVINP